MAYLYLTEDGSVLRKRGERFVVEKEGKELLEVEARRLEGVLMFNTVQVTTQALGEMLEFGVEFAILTRGGRLLGQLTPPHARNLFIRKAQYAKETDPSFRLTQSKAIVRAKLENTRQTLIRHSWRTSDNQDALREVAVKLERLMARADATTDTAELNGVDGQAASEYWSVFGLLLKAEGISFPGRRKRPSPDPVNAVLSFGYVLMSNSIQSLLDGLGLDPFLGFYHEDSYGRASLALDLVEPFRAPVVDRFALRMFNLGILKGKDFETGNDGDARMTREAVRTFFGAWESHLAKMEVRQAVRGQVEQLAKVFRGEVSVISPWLWSARG